MVRAIQLTGEIEPGVPAKRRRAASSHPGLGLPKPEPRKRAKRRKENLELVIKRAVRLVVSLRDRRCRADASVDGDGGDIPPCEGPLEWHHLLKRSASRGLPPEERHNQHSTLMLCRLHHGMAERNEIIHAFVSPPLGANGQVRWWFNDAMRRTR